MDRKELFEKVQIKSEADLPKDGGRYYFHDKVMGGIQSFTCPGSPAVMKHLSEECDWYFKPLPPAEGAEEILASLIESLGEPDNSIHDHSYEIRPLTVNGKCEWWMFRNGVGSGEPLAQWLQNFATLHAQRIAEKMVSERLREELIKFFEYLDEYIPMVIHGGTAEIIINQYLKSRQP